MNIKKSTFRFASAAILSVGALLTACNDIDESNRYEKLPAVEAKRTVLLEEFTGQSCSNCPDAHKIIHELKEQYGENLIVVGIHSGGDAFSIAEGDPVWGSIGIIGLRQPEGETYLSNAGFKTGMGLPIGQINRTSGLIGRNEWSGVIRTEMERDTELDMNVKVEVVDAEDGSDAKELKIETDIRAVAAEVRGNLQLWIIESGIVAYQVDDKTAHMDYVHDHVFRAAVNGINGEEVTIDPDLEVNTFNHVQPVKSNWNVDNLAVVAFVYNGHGVLQATETAVKVSGDDADNTTDE